MSDTQAKHPSELKEGDVIKYGKRTYQLLEYQGTGTEHNYVVDYYRARCTEDNHEGQIKVRWSKTYEWISDVSESGDKVDDIIEQYGGPEPLDDPAWWFDTDNFDGDPTDLF